MNKSILRQTLAYAKDNLDNHPQYLCFPHYTFLVRKSEIIAIGLNRQHEPHRRFGYHNKDDVSFRPKWHSELDAIKRCKRGLINVDIINIRLNRLKETRLAMPCQRCREILNVINAKRIYFTLENEKWGMI